MKKITPVFLIAISLLFSACSKTEVKNKILDKVEEKINKERQEDTQNIPVSDEQLLQDLSSDSDSLLDADLSDFEKELQ